MRCVRIYEHGGPEVLRLEEAEPRGDLDGVGFFSELVATYHDGKYSRQLAGDGSLSLRSEPAGAEVCVHRLVEENLVLQPREPTGGNAQRVE